VNFSSHVKQRPFSLRNCISAREIFFTVKFLEGCVDVGLGSNGGRVLDLRDWEAWLIFVACVWGLGWGVFVACVWFMAIFFFIQFG